MSAINLRKPSFLPFAMPDIDESECAEVRDTLLSGWITTGPKTRTFEESFAGLVGAKHTIAVNSCTAAMHLALEAIGTRQGDEVITSPYTFASTAEVIRYLGAKPIFVDIDAKTFNIDSTKIERAINEGTRAIIPVHIAGLPAEMDAIMGIARKHSLAVIEDAAHAFPARYKGRPVGSIGDVTCFSFYATKTITTGEGGMIATNNDQWAERCRIMSLHGISKDAWNRYAEAGNWYYEIIAPGFKYNMTDVAAAMGLAQIRKADRMWMRRREIAQVYSEAFSQVPQLQIPHEDPRMQQAWHLYMLRINPEMLSIDRNGFISELKDQGIGASVHFIPLHIHPYYRETYGCEPEDFPTAFREYKREISLPIYSRMSNDDVHRVIKAVGDIVKNHQQ